MVGLEVARHVCHTCSCGRGGDGADLRRKENLRPVLQPSGPHLRLEVRVPEKPFHGLAIWRKFHHKGFDSYLMVSQCFASSSV